MNHNDTTEQPVIVGNITSPPPGSMLAHPRVMLALIALLVYKLGGTVSLTGNEAGNGDFSLEEDHSEEGLITLTAHFHKPNGGH